MDMIKRTLLQTIKKFQKNGFINLIYGPRRVGKTTLLKQLIADYEDKSVIWFNGDTQEARQLLSDTRESNLLRAVKDYQVVVVDEAQRISNIGLSLKILVDVFPEKIFYVTGSSPIGLAKGVKESLTGRNLTYNLFPFSTAEIKSQLKSPQITSMLPEQLIYGSYPQLWTLPTPLEKEHYLAAVIDDYLFKDILLLKSIDNPDNLKRLAILLAFQLGSEVSYNELAKNLQIDVKTTQRYIALLKQSFIISEIGSYSRNLRKEIAKGKKYYFWDLGLRNALINQFADLDLRQDRGALWENFLVIERIKKHIYQHQLYNYYFWRTYEKAEIDWLEEKQGQLFAYEFKYRKLKAKTPVSFRDAYKQEVKLINKDNYLDFVL